MDVTEPGAGLGRHPRGNGVRPAAAAVRLRGDAGAGPGPRCRPGRLADRQRVHARPGRGRLAGHGVDLRRRLPGGLVQPVRLRRHALRAAERGPGHLQPPGGRGGLRPAARHAGQPRAAGPGRGAALGPGEHRRVRRRPGPGDRLRRVGRGRGDRGPAGHAGRGRPVRPGHRAERAQHVLLARAGHRHHGGDRRGGRAARHPRGGSGPGARPGPRATAAAFRTADPARLTAAADAVRPGDHLGRWGPVAYTPTPFSPVVDGEDLPAARRRPVPSAAPRHVDLISGHTRDEYRLFMQAYGLQGKITAELASDALAGLGPSTPAGAEASYRVAYPAADPETLFELVHTDWLFRMPTLHLAQGHASSGGRTFLYEFRYPAPAGGLGACHAIDVPLVFGSYAGLGQTLFGPEPPTAAVALGDLMREQWTAFAADGDPGWPLYSPGSRMTRIFDDPPDVAGYPQKASLHLWDQHRFGVLDLETQTAR